MLLPLLAVSTLLLSAADHWTTYLCLRRPVLGWEVSEVNPISAWLFETVGLVPGLLIDTAVTLGAVSFLVVSRRFSQPVKIAFFVAIGGWTAFAVANNLGVIRVLGLSPLGEA